MPLIEIEMWLRGKWILTIFTRDGKHGKTIGFASKKEAQKKAKEYVNFSDDEIKLL